MTTPNQPPATVTVEGETYDREQALWMECHFPMPVFNWTTTEKVRAYKIDAEIMGLYRDGEITAKGRRVLAAVRGEGK